MSDNRALKKKWRPALWMVVFCVLMLVALLPLIGLLLIIGWENLTGTSFKLRSVEGLLTLALGSLLMAGIIGAVFLRALLRPLTALIERTEEIETGNENAFRLLDYGGTQEIATLGERFFRLARRLSERSNYLTLFTTHVSHELKTPLTSIQAAAELLRDGGSSMGEDQRQRFLSIITDETARLAILSTRLRELARAEMADIGGECDLKVVVERCTKTVGLALDIQRTKEQKLPLSEQNLEIVLQQLVVNAVQHDAKILTVLSRRTADGVVIYIGDDGAKIPSENREQVFGAFFTTRRERGGTGMGLGIARAMMRSHGGDVTVSNDADYKFEISIPQ